MIAKECKPITREASIKPSIENVIPYNEYKKTQPRILGVPQVIQGTNDDDMIVLYGGGRDFILSLLDNEINSNKENGINSINVELFILNKCILMWFKDLGRGIEISYNSVIYHGSNRIQGEDSRDGHRYELVVTVERDLILNELFPVYGEEHSDALSKFSLRSVEFKLRPRYSTYDRYYNVEIETLFTFHNFGVNRGDEMVKNCNDAIALCLEMNENQFISSEEEDLDVETSAYDNEQNTMNQDSNSAVYTGINEVYNTYQNSGYGDDLDGNNMIMDNKFMKNGVEAGMSMEFYNNEAITGQKRPMS
ncbi:hypothetical protein Kpol_1055p59 [Vanderwaltozyma polyspora DSM 70294]|uniref:Protein LOT5 n=1 Tax=Vanderwaltozyma polyspora (strain ATCC 22028 / DSM 70294 / BCRC 21397 / CBS 2163 / NBRC 10782 / NRRL Y-8283 / UCD 57-17) TaxID=436907 RepID=LOT5_VANPO|nr:uncharacterized protein Kpol_1055p59 [Vanderwaltozyma polyspora DSM 70294]A7TGD2.1 RecName: Full=Protein LOT5 [Vanderwaltozyma polyspora DSM 70294]EDO18702.1 hypothetical protein Kpol_1055p59 [Vanderwaltozyma polyspora DSM 70294]